MRVMRLKTFLMKAVAGSHWIEMVDAGPAYDSLEAIVTSGLNLRSSQT